MEEKKNTYKVDVTPIYSGEKKRIDISFEIPQEQADIGNGIAFASPIVVEGRIAETASGSTSSEGYVELSLSVTTTLKAECARCLDTVESDFRVEAKYGVTPYLQNAEESESCVMTDDGILDLCELARTLLFLNAPTRLLCKEDCKGICAGCGVNLNYEACQCTEKEIDPRLSALKDFFKK